VGNRRAGTCICPGAAQQTTVSSPWFRFLFVEGTERSTFLADGKFLTTQKLSPVDSQLLRKNPTRNFLNKFCYRLRKLTYFHF
jgi:hypothetical protein